MVVDTVAIVVEILIVRIVSVVQVLVSPLLMEFERPVPGVTSFRWRNTQV